VSNLNVTYRPEPSKQKFCSQTGKPIPVSMNHWLEYADGRHLGIISDNVPNVAGICRKFAAAEEMYEFLKVEILPWMLSEDSGWERRVVDELNAILAKAEGGK